MFTYYQAETIAYMTEGAIICKDCAVKRYTTVGVAKIDAGIYHNPDISPLCRMSIEENSNVWKGECANEEVGQWSTDNAAEWDEAYDSYPDTMCDDCMREIS